MNNQTKTDEKSRVAVAMSGGIDSAFAAHILKSRGFEVFGITVKTCISDNFNLQLESVKKIAEKLAIEYIVLDLEEFFENTIIKPFCKNYLEGKTPNPCVECNKTIKFGILWEKARELGADRIATGHYVGSVKSENGDFFLLKKGLDKNKDQSYFLWKLTQKHLKIIKFPLGDCTKKEIRNKAGAIFPHLKTRAESQEICFIGEKSFQEFLQERYGDKDLIKRGTVLNTKGEIIGRHKGFIYYTVGQRKGLGISHPRPLYVKEIIPETNTIVMGEEGELYSNSFYLKDINFISGSTPDSTFNANTKIRYNSPEFPSKINVLKGNRASVKTDIPQKAVTPGQSAVFYNGDIMIGGGIIE
jgi:tRNA-specific 2-thiouridylase